MAGRSKTTEIKPLTCRDGRDSANCFLKRPPRENSISTNSRNCSAMPPQMRQNATGCRGWASPRPSAPFNPSAPARCCPVLKNRGHRSRLQASKLREVLECGSPLPLWHRRRRRHPKSARGLAQSKTLARLRLSQNYRRDELCESPTYEFSGELGARVTRPSDKDMLLRQPRLTRPTSKTPPGRRSRPVRTKSILCVKPRVRRSC